MEAARTCARVVGGIGAPRARTAIQALGPRAVVLHDLALGAGVALGALARVAAGAGVEARAAVPAGFVVGAVVEVLVAEEAAPALVAHAVPRLDAAAVDAAGVPLALIAQRPFPAGLTSASTIRVAVKSNDLITGRVVTGLLILCHEWNECGMGAL